MTGKERILLYRAIMTGIVIVAILFILLWWKGCHCGSVKPSNTDTISVKIDTVWIKRKDSIVYVPQSVKVWYPHDSLLHDTLEVFEPGTPFDTLQFIHGWKAFQDRFFAKRYYDTVLSIQYGTAKLRDTVTQNRISGRSVVIQQSIPQITKTVTLIAPKRVTMYLSLSAIGNDRQHLFGTGAGLDLMDKKGRMYGISYLFTKDYSNMVMAEIKIPIRLRKK